MWMVNFNENEITLVMGKFNSQPSTHTHTHTHHTHTHTHTHTHHPSKWPFTLQNVVYFNQQMGALHTILLSK